MLSKMELQEDRGTHEWLIQMLDALVYFRYGHKNYYFKYTMHTISNIQNHTKFPKRKKDDQFQLKKNQTRFCTSDES